MVLIKSLQKSLRQPLSCRRKISSSSVSDILTFSGIDYSHTSSERVVTYRGVFYTSMNRELKNSLFVIFKTVGKDDPLPYIKRGTSIIFYETYLYMIYKINQDYCKVVMSSCTSANEEAGYWDKEFLEFDPKGMTQVSVLTVGGATLTGWSDMSIKIFVKDYPYEIKEFASTISARDFKKFLEDHECPEIDNLNWQTLKFLDYDEVFNKMA